MQTHAHAKERSLWFCLYLPRLGLELFTRSLEDGAAARPSVLVNRHRLEQLNAAALARGLRPGQSLATAQSICPDLGVGWRDPERESIALRHLADWAWRFTPRVSLAEPDGLLLEVAGSLRLFRGLDRLQQQILDGIRELGYSGLPGIAPTPLAAQALARAGCSPDPEQLATDLACDAMEDGGLRRAWCDAVADAVRPRLAGLPLHHLERPAAEQERLAAMGLRTLADLLRLPRHGLGRRFGRDLLEHLDRLTGRRPDPRRPLQPAAVFTARLHFLEDVTHTTALVFPMRRLIAELVDWLRVRQLACGRLQWILGHPRHGEHRLEVRCARPQRDPHRFLELSRLYLDRSQGLPEVATLALKVEDLQAHGGLPDTLFPLPGEGQKDPAALLDLLRARLGHEACCSVLPKDDHRPERAWRLIPPALAQRERNATQGGIRGPRPLWLLDPPRPLSSHDGRPCWHGVLILQRGPERLDLMPWGEAPLAGTVATTGVPATGVPATDIRTTDIRTTDIRSTDTCQGPRDYWVARHPQGGHCWVFQSLASGRWFLHGIFA